MNHNLVTHGVNDSKRTTLVQQFDSAVSNVTLSHLRYFKGVLKPRDKNKCTRLRVGMLYEAFGMCV